MKFNFINTLIRDLGDIELLRRELRKASNSNLTRELLTLMVLNTSILKGTKFYYESTQIFRKKNIRLSNSTKNKYIKIYTEILKILILVRQEDFSNVKHRLDSIKSTILETNSSHLLGLFHELYFEYYFNFKDPKMIPSIKETITLFKHSKGPEAVYRAECNLLASYIVLKKDENAENLVQKLLKSKLSRKNIFIRTKLLNNLGVIYFNKHKFKKSIRIFEQIIKNARKMNDRNLELRILGNIAGLYFYNDNPQKSIDIYQSLIQDPNNHQRKSNLLLWYYNLAYAYVKLGETVKAIKYLNKYISLSEEQALYDRVINGSFFIAQIFFREKLKKKLKLFSSQIKNRYSQHPESIQFQALFLLLDFMFTLLRTNPTKYIPIINEYRNKFNSLKSKDKYISQFETIIEIYNEYILT